MRTRIISAFPGVGKTYFFENKKEYNCLDSDSSNFSWIIENNEKKRNPDFPNNYITHIKQNIGKYDFIFISSHKEIREALIENCIHFYLVYPDFLDAEEKERYMNIYKNRGNDEDFVKLISLNWEKWLKECFNTKQGCINLMMMPKKGWNLEKIIDLILRYEKDEV